MDFIQLKTFCEVASCGSLTAASETLSTSQPALSRQIVALEKEIGLNLFIRHSRGVKLTEAGRRLYEYAEKILRLVENAEKALGELRDLESGIVTIGSSTTVGNYLLPSWLAGFSKIHPKIDVSLQVDNTSTVISKLLEGRIDLGLIAGEVTRPEFCQETLVNDEVILLTAPDHHLRTEQTVSPSHLNNEVLILREQGSATREVVEAFLKNHKVKPRRIITLGNTEAIKGAVMAGMGITFLSKFTVKVELQHNLLYPLPDPLFHIQRPFVAIYPKGVRLSPAILTFLCTIKKRI